MHAYIICLISVHFKRVSSLVQFLRVVTFTGKPDSLCSISISLGFVYWDNLAIDLKLPLNSWSSFFCLLDFTAMYRPCPTFRIYSSTLLCFVNCQERNVICRVSLRSLTMAALPEPHWLHFPALKDFHFLTEQWEMLRNLCSSHCLSLLINIPVALSAFPHPSYAGQRQPRLRLFFAGEVASSPP